MTVPVAALVGVPQFEQKRAPLASGDPQAAQLWFSADPHSEQNFEPAVFAVPQFEHTMRLGLASLAETVPHRAATFREA